MMNDLNDRIEINNEIEVLTDLGVDPLPVVIDAVPRQQLKAIQAAAHQASAHLDPDDEPGVAAFLGIAEGHVLLHFSRAEKYRGLWAVEMLGLGCWLCAVFKVLNPKGKFTEWFVPVCESYFTYQTGRNWRRIWEFVTEGHLPLKTILSGESDLNEALVIGRKNKLRAAGQEPEQQRQKAIDRQREAEEAERARQFAELTDPKTRRSRTPWSGRNHWSGLHATRLRRVFVVAASLPRD